MAQLVKRIGCTSFLKLTVGDRKHPDRSKTLNVKKLEMVFMMTPIFYCYGFILFFNILEVNRLQEISLTAIDLYQANVAIETVLFFIF